MALKSGSLNLNGMFDTCNLFGWFFESVEEIVARVVTDVVIGAIVGSAVDVDDADKFEPVEAAAAAATAAAATAFPIILASNVCCAVVESVSVFCNKSGWTECTNWHCI